MNYTLTLLSRATGEMKPITEGSLAEITTYMRENDPPTHKDHEEVIVLTADDREAAEGAGEGAAKLLDDRGAEVRTEAFFARYFRAGQFSPITMLDPSQPLYIVERLEEDGRAGVGREFYHGAAGEALDWMIEHAREIGAAPTVVVEPESYEALKAGKLTLRDLRDRSEELAAHLAALNALRELITLMPADNLDRLAEELALN